MPKYLLLILVYTITSIFSNDDEDDDTTDDKDFRKFCRERNRLISGTKDDYFNLVEAHLSENIRLQCHFCNEKSDDDPKNWFKLDRLNDSKIIEVELGTDNNMSLNRIYIDIELSLIIKNITEEDAGEYFCKKLDSEIETNNLLNFYVDVISKTDVQSEKGNMSAWKVYHDEQFGPINKLMSISTEPDYIYLKHKMKINFEVVTEWDEEGPCEVCGRPKGDARKYKTGHCRLKLESRDTTKLAKNYNEKLLMRATHLSCRSLALKNIIPGIINKTEKIPDFILIEPCTGICNPDAEGVYKGWKSTKKKGYKYRKTFVLAENAHLTIICPESTLENQVVWRLNGKVIKPGESVLPASINVEPKITVDTFNTLYLYGVTKDEEGNYTCQVDEVRMQQVRVFVVSKAKLLTQAFVRHMMYLAFILSLTLSCYCAGLVITWTRRRKFKTYQQIRAELKEQNKLIDSDSEESIGVYEKVKKKFTKKRRNYENLKNVEEDVPGEEVSNQDKIANTDISVENENTKTPKSGVTFNPVKDVHDYDPKYKRESISKSSKANTLKGKKNETHSTSPLQDSSSPSF